MEIKMLKLITSEEIICEVVKVEKDKLIIKNPFAVAPSLDTPYDGSRRLSVFPWSLAILDVSDTEYEISSHAVIMIADAPEQIANSYRSKVTGLAVPNTGIITG